MIHSHTGKQSIETSPVIGLVLTLANKDVKQTIIHSKNSKKKKCKELKENGVLMSKLKGVLSIKMEI